MVHAMSKVEVDETKPKCVIVDVDGTLALHVNRKPFEYEKCSDDAPNPRVVEVVKMLKGTYEIVVCSGREATGNCAEDTKAWLHRHGITFSAFFIRGEGDFRKDSEIKREFLVDHILPRWNPVLVIDDRQQVVDMWRDAGLECWQVAPGNF